MRRNCIAMYGLGGLDDLRWPDMDMQVTVGAYVYVRVGVLPGGYDNDWNKCQIVYVYIDISWL